MNEHRIREILIKSGLVGPYLDEMLVAEHAVKGLVELFESIAKNLMLNSNEVLEKDRLIEELKRKLEDCAYFKSDCTCSEDQLGCSIHGR